MNRRDWRAPVARLAHNQEVGSSILPVATITGRMDASGPPISLAGVPMASGAATLTGCPVQQTGRSRRAVEARNQFSPAGDKATGARASGHFMGKKRSKS